MARVSCRIPAVMLVLSACAQRAPVSVDAVRAPVEIGLDKVAIQIRARTDTDAFAAMGWAHAELYGAELRREQCRVRGCDEPTLASRLQLVPAAERRLLRSEPEERRLLDAYARGVNAADPTLDWQASDSMALTLLRSLRHATGLRTEIAALNAQDLGVLDLDDVLRDDGLATETTWDDLRGGLPRVDGLAQWATTPPADASAVAVGARRSASSLPLVGAVIGQRQGDAGLVAVAVASPGFEVTGLTQPGIPAFWMGRNRTTAWALIPANADAMDLVVVGLQGNTYTAFGESFVLAEGDMTSMGPVVARNEDLGLVLRVAGLDDTDETLPTLWDMARSDGVVEAVRAFDRPVGSAWHLVAGDVEGHIADAVVGRIVRRRGVTGRVPHDVRDVDRWQGRLDRLPRLLDPPMGVVASTGARPQGPVAGAMGTDFPDAARAERLAAEVGWRAEMDAATLWTVLLDTSVQTGSLTDLLSPLRPATEQGEQCRDALMQWNGDALAPQSAIWRAWRAELTRRTLSTWSDATAEVWRATAGVDPDPPGAPWRARPLAERASALDAACAEPPMGVGVAGTLRPSTSDQAVAGGFVVDLASPGAQVWIDGRLVSLAPDVELGRRLVPPNVD